MPLPVSLVEDSLRNEGLVFSLFGILSSLLEGFDVVPNGLRRESVRLVACRYLIFASVGRVGEVAGCGPCWIFRNRYVGPLVPQQGRMCSHDVQSTCIPSVYATLLKFIA